MEWAGGRGNVNSEIQEIVREGKLELTAVQARDDNIFGHSRKGAEKCSESQYVLQIATCNIWDWV